jgi:hypothetical protein
MSANAGRPAAEGDCFEGQSNTWDEAVLQLVTWWPTMALQPIAKRQLAHLLGDRLCARGHLPIKHGI